MLALPKQILNANISISKTNWRYTNIRSAKTNQRYKYHLFTNKFHIETVIPDEIILNSINLESIFLFLLRMISNIVFLLRCLRILLTILFDHRKSKVMCLPPLKRSSLPDIALQDLSMCIRPTFHWYILPRNSWFRQTLDMLLSNVLFATLFYPP